MSTLDLGAGKIIWVTGGAGYLGSPVVMELDQRGVKTVIFDLPGKAEAMVKERGLQFAVPVSFDLARLEEQAALIDRVIAEHGVPDGLAHLTFASSSGKTLDQLSAEDFNRTLTLSLTPTFTFCRAVAERMAKRGSGSIVLFSSMYGLVSPDPRIYSAPMAPNPIDYGTSKAGVVQMMRYFAVHFGPRGVRFNALAPGPFPNPNIQKQMPEFVAKLTAKTALNRVGQAPEVVGPTLFLLSDAASYVTGHCLTVDGGWTTW